MGSEAASAEADRDKAKDGRPPALDEQRDGTAAAAAAGSPSPTTAAAGLRPKSVVGPADDGAERRADESAERVLRMPDPTTVPPASPGAAGGPPGPAGTPPEAIRRVADPAAEQRVPGTPAVKPVGTGSAGGTGPDTATSAGPAPLVSPPIAAGARPAETGTPAPDPEPPAPAGEAPARETPAVSPELQAYLDASRGKGAPLPDGVRKEFEARFQRPFDDVRIHDDAGADDAARTIDALAFTRGSDIYFRSGAFDPASEPGRRLLAHELAHVVQNRPGINRKAAPAVGPVIRRKPTKSTDAGTSTKPKGTKPSFKSAKPEGDIDTGAKTLKFATLQLPAFKASRTKGALKWRNTGEKRKNTQRDIWLADTKNLADAAKSLAARATSLGVSLDDVQTFRFQNKGGTQFFFGTGKELAAALVIPPWSRKGTFQQFQVDHIHEWQLGGADEDITNYELLAPVPNRTSGNAVKNTIRKQIDEFLTAANVELESPQTVASVKASPWSVTWTAPAPDDTPGPSQDERWSRDEIGKPEYMSGLTVVSDAKAAALEGTKDKLAIYRSASGGQVAHPAIHKGSTYRYTGQSKHGASSFKEVEWELPGPNTSSTGRVASVHGVTVKKSKVSDPQVAEITVPVRGIPKAVPWGGYIDKKDVAAERTKALLTIPQTSPVTFDDLGYNLDDGLEGRGRIPKPSLRLLERAEINVILDDGEVGLEAVITGEQLNLPGPFKVTGGELTLSATTGGLKIDGQVDFEIKGLARGFIHAGAAAKTGGASFELDGRLDFDTKMFTEAKLGVSYSDGKWGVNGNLAVGPDKIKGIKSAQASVAISDDTVTATGEFVPTLKGVQKGTLGFRYGEATGMEITGEILIGEGIPGIKSGRLGATIKEGPDKHSLSGDIMLEPAIPGVTGTASGRYDDGAFSVDAQLGYEHGFAKGAIHLGVTNQTVGTDGKPAGEPKKDGSLTVWGDGQVTLQLTPWLVGTVGLKLTPDGQVEVSGEVALPPTFTVFDEKKVEKTLLAIHVDIPIVGVAVAGQRIGIFATIGGSLKVDAGIGPGVLRDVALKVSYNPAKPEATTVTGNATFAIPAHAGLRLTVEGAVGAGIPVVSAKAGLQVYGEIGVAGEASAGALVTWSPAAGVVLDARGEIFVEPKFKFGIDAFVDVSADLWVTEIELYHETWHLAAFEYGSNLRFGLAMPIHYESGKPFDVSFDQLQWTYPHIEPAELIGGLVKQIVG